FDHAYPLRVLVVAIVLVACRDRLVRSFVRPSLSAFGIGVVAYVAWIAFGRASGSFHGAPVELSSMGSVLATAWIAFRIVGAVVTVPLAEELAFRGYVSDRLLGSPDAIPWRREVLAFAVSSVAFGLLHERVVAAVVAGGLCHLAYRRRRCVSDAVTAHAVTNALVALHVSATGDWSWWR
ncbi:MAG: CAAX prenyl protease-related protein, partial [Polyangiaceae bacterium]